MRVVFRADASLEIGSGHVMRCLTLAKALRERGAECIFVCRSHPGNLLELIRHESFQAFELPLPASFTLEGEGGARLAHADWLGTDWRSDAQETLMRLAGGDWDWLVVDHYALDWNWEEALRARCRRILAIDDLADRVHACDVLLDQNLVVNMETRYQGKVPQGCKGLLGPRFALLQSHYAALHLQVPPREGRVARVLVYFGGADNANLTSMTLSAFLALGRTDVTVDVVINPDGPHTQAIREQVRGLDCIRLHERLPSLAPLMLRADLAIGASGATSWERCCLGLPSLVVTLADNQKPIADELDRRGLVRWLGDQSEVQQQRLGQALAEALDGELDPAWSAQCQEIVDGYGAERVACLMFLHPDSGLSARAARWVDEPFIDEMLAGQAISPGMLALLSAAQGWHRAWFRTCLREPERYTLQVIESECGQPLALAVFESGERGGRMYFAADSLLGQVGLSSRALVAALLAFRQSTSGVITICPVATEGASEGGCDGSLDISVCSDRGSWINDSVPELLLEWLAAGHRVSWAHEAAELPGGDLCFYLSYGRIVGRDLRGRYRNNLVVHASDLPKGRGWSPASWLILEGAERIPVTLLEAVDQVDAGPIYRQEWLELDGSELIGDWHRLLAEATIRLARDFVINYPDILRGAREQTGESSAYPRRRPKDSEIEPTRTIAEIFDHLRIVDNDHYPAFFRYRNAEFRLKISRKT